MAKNDLSSDYDDICSFFKEKQGVVISTIHGVKGEEYNTVIGFGLLNGVIPHWDYILKSDLKPIRESETKKLLYVLMSRAKQNLFLFSENDRITKNGSPLSPTDELSKIQQRLLLYIGVINMTDFETLIKQNGVSSYNDRWHPHNVDVFKELISQGILSDIQQNVLSNIAYNLQYLEYLQLQIDELKLHSIISCLLYKTYIVTTMSIIEAIFNQAIKCSNKWPKTDGWTLNRIIKSNEYNENNKNYYIETHIMIKEEPQDKELDFSTVINRVKDKNILDLNNEHFPDLSKLRKLRNRVHLQIGESRTDTDYYQFQYEDVELAKKTLYCVLTDTKIMENQENKCFIDFLNT